MDKIENIVIAGAGSIGTALGHVLSFKKELNVTLVTIEPDVAEAISKDHINHKYFPNIELNKNLKATTNHRMLSSASIVLLAVPSIAVVDYLSDYRSHISEEAILVNLAKGFGKENRTIAECLEMEFSNPVCSLKGPTFARELINHSPTSFTLASKEKEHFKRFSNIFSKTGVFLDYTTDLLGVELLSMLKNIYAIIMGIVDAHFNTSNLRFLILTKALNEMRDILIKLGGEKKTVFKYCGIGDFALTALNDLSRNRTLGLLIGKGFFTKEISDKVVLEGRIAVNVFYEKLKKENLHTDYFPMMEELHKVFNDDYDINKFVGNILNRERLVINP